MYILIVKINYKHFEILFSPFCLITGCMVDPWTTLS